MTVKVRQLMRSAGKGMPPIPPPVPTMAFVQQPTDTFINTLFNPTVTVQISDGASDSLTISSPTCDILPVTVTADSTGLAIFAGLQTGPTASSGCTLVLHNNSRPTIADVTSLPFNITTALTGIEIVNGGTSYILQRSVDSITLAAYTQWTGGLWDTSGANVRLYFVANSDPPPNNLRVRTVTGASDLFDDERGQDPVGFNAFPERITTSGIRIVSPYWVNPLVGPLCTFFVREPAGFSPTITTFPVAAAFGLSGVDTVNPIIVGLSNQSTGNVVQISAVPIAVNGSGMAISVFAGAFSTFESSGIADPVPPAGYPNAIFVNSNAMAWGMGIAWKFGPMTTEQPVWTVNESNTFAVGFIALRQA